MADASQGDAPPLPPSAIPVLVRVGTVEGEGAARAAATGGSCSGSGPGESHSTVGSSAGAGAATAIGGGSAEVVPDDFGAIGGTSISNKHTILQEVDEALGVEKPPDVEYILVRPFAMLRLPFGFGICYNTYGHAAVRYTRPNGEQVVMNIVGKKSDASMVQFSRPEEYMYGTKFDHSTEQKGLYNRAMITVRVENVEPDKIEAMHEFFMDLRDKHNRHEAEFHLFMSPVYNFLSSLNLPIAKRGNCAWWTSSGLEKAGVITMKSLWPKSVLVNIFENAERTSAKTHDNVHIVSYRRVQVPKMFYGIDATPISAVAPLQSLRSLAYWNLENFADVIVEVPPGSTAAVVRKHENPGKPSWIRNMVNNKLVIWTSVLVTGVALGRAAGAFRAHKVAADAYRGAAKAPEVGRWRQMLRRRREREAASGSKPPV